MLSDLTDRKYWKFSPVYAILSLAAVDKHNGAAGARLFDLREGRSIGRDKATGAILFAESRALHCYNRCYALLE